MFIFGEFMYRESCYELLMMNALILPGDMTPSFLFPLGCH